MAWQGGCGSGSMYMSSSDTFVTGIVSAQAVYTKTAVITSTSTFGGVMHVNNGDLRVISEDAGSSEGPGIDISRFSSSPASGDSIGTLRFKFKNASGTETTMAKIGPATIHGISAGNESCKLPIVVRNGGTLANRLFIGGGLFSPSATGSDQGADTANFSAVYDDGVLLTCYVLEAERTGGINMAEMDSAVPAKIFDVSSYWEAPNSSGGVSLYQSPPRRVEEKTPHAPARMFHQRMDATLDPKTFGEIWQQTGHLPGLPSRQEWFERVRQGKKYSLGDMVQRLIELTEVQAVHIERLRQRIDDLEGEAAPKKAKERVH